MKLLRLIPLTVAALMISGCDRTPEEWRTPNMTPLTPRLQQIFEKTKTVCFGRFMVDVPESTRVVWGETDIDLGVSVYPNGVGEVQVLAQKFIDDLKSEKAINQNDVPLLISVDDVSTPEGKIVVGYEDFQAIDEFKINGYFRLQNDGVVINARPLREDKDEVIGLIRSIAARLRQRAEDEIPSEPGNCIEHAFLPDKVGTDSAPHAELIRIGFRLKEFPDTHLSIFVGPSNPNYSESDSLQWRLEQLEKNQKAEDPNNPLLRTKNLRRGGRHIHEWINGFEALSRTPEQPEAHSIHDFAMDFRGVPSDLLKPYAEIQMQTGVSGNEAGATKATLTDEEAVAVWDKITGTVRVRPTRGSSGNSAGPGPQPRSPIGELAVTGRICPQGGWWEPDDASDKGPHRRRLLKAGERMPYLMVTGEPSLWQKLKGERPIYRNATTWKLVAYDDDPALNEWVAATPTTPEASAGSSGQSDTGAGTTASAKSPSKKG